MIILMGVAGSGKSLQGRILADRYGLPWLSTGEFLRMLISGEKRKKMLAGHLLEDRTIIELVRKIFGFIESDKEFVLDGFPRTIAQADWLLNQSKHDQLNITAVIHLVASQEVVKSRLLKRGRQDDQEESISQRFDEYQDTILPILNEFKANGITVFDIDAAGTVEEIYKNIDSRVGSLIK